MANWKHWERKPFNQGDRYTHDAWRATFWHRVPDTERDVTGHEPPDAINAGDAYAINADPKQIVAACKLADQERARYAMNCVEIEAGAEGIRFTASDGRRLCSLLYGKDEQHHKYFHVDAKALAYLVTTALKTVGRDGHLQFRVMPVHQAAHTKTVNVGYYGEREVEQQVPARDTFALACVGKAGRGTDCAFMLEAQDGQWPDWRAILPDTRYAVTLPEGFFEAVDVLQKVTCVISQAVRLEITPDATTLRAIRASAPRVEAQSVLAPCGTAEGMELQELVIGLDPVYLLEMHDMILAEYPYAKTLPIEMHYNAADKGVLFKAPDGMAGRTYLVMPTDR